MNRAHPSVVSGNRQPHATKPPIHYQWKIVFAAILGVVLAVLVAVLSRPAPLEVWFVF